jgi:hypothetical protein
MKPRNFRPTRAFTASAMNTEEHDDLWNLLGKARETKVSPYFSRNVLRALCEEQQEKPHLFSWLFARWKFAAIGAAALIIVAGVVIEREARPDPMLVLADQVSASPDYSVISHLDELLDSEQNSVWLEASAF